MYVNHYTTSAGLGEFRIRDLNDEINKLLREKRHWEDQIRELGGPDYFRVGPRMLDHEGREVPGNRGYRYFGAAKDLPGNNYFHQYNVNDMCVFNNIILYSISTQGFENYLIKRHPCPLVKHVLS